MLIDYILDDCYTWDDFYEALYNAASIINPISCRKLPMLCAIRKGGGGGGKPKGWKGGKEEKPKPAPKPIKEPGKPSEGDGFVPPKNWDGEMVPNPNGPGKGYPDKSGDVWVPTGTGGAPRTGTTGPAHGGAHWDVQTPGGGYRNVYPGGKVRP
jgi:hypothetical protein